MPHYVYELIDPRTNEIRYVGITTRLEVRFTQHLNGINDINEHKTAWIQELKEQGLQPQMRIIETVDSREKARERERYWVRHYLDQNIQLTNSVLVPLIKRSIPRLSRRGREFFNQLNKEWERLTKLNQPLTTRRLSSLFNYYTSNLDTRFPSKRGLVPLWKKKKQEEVQMMLTDPDKYGLLPTFPGDTGIIIV